MSRYGHHKYTWAKPFTSVRHTWELVGPDCAVYFHASIYDGQSHDPSCGLEFHWGANHPDRPQDEAPHHKDCPLLKGHCWHDGTSSYASEYLWPVISDYLRTGEHEKIFRLLEQEADRKFARREQVNTD